MKKLRSKITVLLGALTLAGAGAASAASVYIDQTGAAPFTNNYNVPGINGYWWSVVPSATSQAIGSAGTGKAWVESSWGAYPSHPANASYNVSADGGTSGTPFTVNQTTIANGAAVGGPEWSGFGHGTSVTGFTSNATLNISGAQGVSTTRVSMLNGTLVKASDQLANPFNVGQGWLAGQSGACSSPGDGGYYWSTAPYFQYTPGLTGTFNLEASWGAYSSHSSFTGWQIDALGNGTWVDLALGINSAGYSNGIVPTGMAGSEAQWSGFYSLGNVTLTASSIIGFTNYNAGTAGAVSDLQLTSVVPEPGTIGLLAVAGAGFLALARRKRALLR